MPAKTRSKAVAISMQRRGEARRGEQRDPKWSSGRRLSRHYLTDPLPKGTSQRRDVSTIHP
jgi:hypothetical protein